MSTEPPFEPANSGSESTLGRRALLAGAAGAAAAGMVASLPAAVGAIQDATATSESKPATFVLVPGQWTGAFVWHKVAPLLRAAGHEVYPVTCTGLGERVHLTSAAIDLDTFITDVVNVLEFEDLHDVILVGHSSGGMIIAGVAERVPERLAQLVYLDASAPEDGQNDYNFDFPSQEAYDAGVAAEIAGSMEAGMPGFVPVYPDVVEWVRGMAKDPDEAEWFIAKLVPHPQLTKLQPVRIGNPAAAALPRTFVFCKKDALESSTRIAERVRSDPTWRFLELDDNHLVNLNDPEGTAEAFLSLL